MEYNIYSCENCACAMSVENLRISEWKVTAWIIVFLQSEARSHNHITTKTNAHSMKDSNKWLIRSRDVETKNTRTKTFSWLFLAPHCQWQAASRMCKDWQINEGQSHAWMDGLQLALRKKQNKQNKHKFTLLKLVQTSALEDSYNRPGMERIKIMA